MKNTLSNVLAVVSLILLTSCSEKKNNMKITSETAPTAPVSRSEPIFYNGKTYRLNFSQSQDGSFDMSVNGMSGKQEKDAVAVATSSLRYFACKDSQSSKLTSKPNYMDGKWQMKARCV